MAKTYKTWEAMKMLTENPKLRFRQTGCDAILRVTNNEIKVWHNDNYDYEEDLLITETWALIKQLVTWQEAIPAMLDGKTIRVECEGCGFCRFNIEKQDEVCTEAFSSGTWYIEEGE